MRMMFLGGSGVLTGVRVTSGVALEVTPGSGVVVGVGLDSGVVLDSVVAVGVELDAVEHPKVKTSKRLITKAKWRIFKL